MSDMLTFSIKTLTKAPVAADPDAPHYLAGGGEGDVFRLPEQDDMVAKIYHSCQLTSARQRKVLDLCSRYETFAGLLATGGYAFPELPAFDTQSAQVVGFSMAFMKDTHNLELLTYGQDQFREAQGVSLDDEKAIALIYDMFQSLANLHSARIILGDVNPGNILYDPQTKRPVFIDLDAARVDDHACTAYMDEYIDPRLVEDGVDDYGNYKFDTGSDHFALACIAFRLFVGSDPFGFRGLPVQRADERKLKRICLMGFLENPDYANITGTTLLANPQNDIRLGRLKTLKAKDKLLYDYLYRVFTHDHRESLMRSRPTTDLRHPEYSFHAARSGRKVKTIVDLLKEGNIKHQKRKELRVQMESETKLVDPKKIIDALNSVLDQHSALRLETQTLDPKGFSAFIENLGFSYDALVTQGTKS